ncbi:unnamed protein product [Rotaria sordida]|uniref:F-box domain-containing protein n=1 Tax=Rotaria sordida TaxID=392033 RepID=A0A819PK55_9BILA|nr:unnamed protein product [Rotaria sordida]
MLSNTISSMKTLPVELLHRIFDNLDAETILLSIRPVSRLFRLVVDNYDRYVFDLKLISKSNFYLLCRLISPKNVISLIFFNNQQTLGQLDLFLSLVRLQEFTRLRSLIFINIDEFQLNFILKRINCNTLTSLSCNIRIYDARYKNATTSRLSSIIAQSTLRKLKLDISAERMLEISWPSICTIEYLTINDRITMDNLCKISQCSPDLHTLVMKKTSQYITNNLTLANHLAINFRQLTSLIIDEIDVTIDQLESFLLLTPSLIHLKLIDGQNTLDRKRLIDGERWEEFIKINLPQLEKFEFYFNEWRLTKQTKTDLELTIASFRTPFWIEYKKWFVICECDMKYSFNIRLYSIPICTSSVFYTLNSKKIFSSTYPMTIDQDVSVMDNINLVYFGLTQSVGDHTEEKVCYST